MTEIELLRKIRREIDSHLHFEVGADNWKESIYLVDVLKDIDNFLKNREVDYDRQ